MTPELTCSDCRQRLLWHVAGQLPADESAAVHHHLAHCTACQREAGLWDAVAAALDDADRGIPPDTQAAGGWLALRGRLSEYPIPLSSQSRGTRLVETTVEPQRPAPGHHLAGIPGDRHPSRRPLIALLAASLLIALSAALFGVFGSQLRQSKRLAVAATSTPTPAACASSALSASLPANSRILDISMTSARDGWAVGQMWDQSQQATPPSPLMFRFQNCRWMPVSDLSDITGPATELFSVAMDSPTDGWAVGTYDKDTPYVQANGITAHEWIGIKLLVLHYASGQWRPMDVPAGGNALSAQVAVISAGEGWMLVYGGKSHTDPYTPSYAYHLFHYLDGSWNSVPLTFDASGTLEFSDVAAAAPGECWVVGLDATGRDHFAVAHYANGKWQTWSSEQIGAGAYGILDHIALTGPDDAWVVGRSFYPFVRGQNYGPFISRFTGTGWVKQELPATQDQQLVDVSMTDIAMLSPAEGWAFFPSDVPRSNPPQAKALHFVDGHWQWVTLPSPITFVYSLSRSSPTQGFAVVTLADSWTHASFEDDLVYYDNGAWSIVPNR
jgi:hypothetical protein